jgi:multidrug efflux pump subunit AcrA (membrane-fusion protein)
MVREGVLEEVNVRTGDSQGSRVEIVAGLAQGDRVVLRPTEALRPGVSVKEK